MKVSLILSSFLLFSNLLFTSPSISASDINSTASTGGVSPDPVAQNPTNQLHVPDNFGDNGPVTPIASTYDPTTVDWQSLIDSIEFLFASEKRLCNFAVRLAFHDSGAFSDGVGGADGSVILNLAESLRPENDDHNFVSIMRRALRDIQIFYQVSWSDIIAVAGALGTECLNGPRVRDCKFGLKMGKLDTAVADPAGILPPPFVPVAGFLSFWRSLQINLSVQEMMALMGSHTLIATQTCERTQSGIQVMFNWVSNYFVNLLAGKLTIEPTLLDPLDFTRNETISEEECKFTSQLFKDKAKSTLELQLDGLLPPDVPDTPDVVKWQFYHSFTKWPYTINDALLSTAARNPSNADETAILEAVTALQNNAVWNVNYPEAYCKMVSVNAHYAPSTGGQGILLSNLEGCCSSGYVSLTSDPVSNRYCTKYCVSKTSRSKKCPAYCKCKTSPKGVGTASYQP